MEVPAATNKATSSTVLEVRSGGGYSVLGVLRFTRRQRYHRDAWKSSHRAQRDTKSDLLATCEHLRCFTDCDMRPSLGAVGTGLHGARAAAAATGARRVASKTSGTETTEDVARLLPVMSGRRDCTRFLCVKPGGARDVAAIPTQFAGLGKKSDPN